MSLRTNVKEISHRMRRGVSDMSYAQRRVFENRTGIAVADPRASAGHDREPVIASTPDELEALYARDVRMISGSRRRR